jgi:biopolymer transport protein ExbB/TolQ
MATVETAGVAASFGTLLETLMFGISQLFLVPVLLAIAFLFLYAFYALGAFAWQWRQRQRQVPAAFELLEARCRLPDLSLAELEAEAVTRLEFIRIVTRVTPMLGLVATMIPMGPALKALGDGQLMDVSRSLMVAFSAVILALIASALTYWIANVRKRWYAVELLQIERDLGGGA